MSGFVVEPDVLVAQAGRRERDADRLDRIASRVGGESTDPLALGVMASWVLGDVEDSVDAVAELVRTLAENNRVLATALRRTVRDHVETDKAVAASFGEAP